MINGAGIKEGRDGYRRGLILGFTMAEVLLLLLFCLIMAVAAVHQRSNPEKMRQELESTKAELSALNLEMSKFKDLANVQMSAKTFERLVRLLSSLNTEQLTQLADTTPQNVINAAELAKLNPAPEDWRELQEYQKLLRIKNPKPRIEELSDALENQATLRKLGIENRLDAKTIEAVRKALERLRSGSEGLNEWPPIISLSEADNNFFERGSAVLAPSFVSSLQQQVTTKLAQTLDEYNVDLIEVIGHTDEQPISNRPTNLDTKAVSVLLGNEPTSSLVTADNAGLGLARAIAVTRVLRAQPALKGISILPYSAGQLVLPNDETTNGADARDEKSRRRIEIRVRRKEPQP